MNYKETKLRTKNLNNRVRKKATTYNVGDYVMITNVDTTAGVNKKFIPKYRKPYVVKKVLDFDRYIVADIPDFQITQMPWRGIRRPYEALHP